MAYRLLTCPETAHLELVEYVDDPLGMLINACSRFRPPCGIDCPRTCAARLDRGVRCQRAVIAPAEIGDDTAVVDLLTDATYANGPRGVRRTG